MPGKISIPSSEQFDFGLANLRTEQWLKRRATEAKSFDLLERDAGYIELRDFREHFDEPLPRDDVHFIVRFFLSANSERISTDIFRFESLVNSPSVEPTCLLLWLQKSRLDVGKISLVDEAIDAIYTIEGDAKIEGRKWEAKEVEVFLDQLHGDRAGGWSHVVEEALRKIRDTAAGHKRDSGEKEDIRDGIDV